MNKSNVLKDYNKVNTTLESCAKIFPPYGRKIDQIRKKGLIPAKRVIVSTRWEIGKAYPRIVVTNEVPVRNLQFRYLAGLCVQVVHFDSDDFTDELVEAIKCCKPKQLCLFNMDSVKAGLPAFKIIQPQKVTGVGNA